MRPGPRTGRPCVMEIRMEHTEGLGGLAEVWVDGTLLSVCDGVSVADEPCRPGLIESVQLQYVSLQSVSLALTAAENRSNKKYLDPVQQWTYVGYGQVVSIMPVVVDFGLVQMADSNWVTDESFVGRYVAVPIDRLEIVPANKPDWPEEIE